MTRYVVGFAFGPGRESVLLIRKNRPQWQAGKLNGIGGHVEDGEEPAAAQAREFWEETGVETAPEDWKYFCTMRGDGWEVVCYWTELSDLWHEQKTDEVIATCRVGLLPEDVLPNLRWLIPMALCGDMTAAVTYKDKL